MAINPFRETEGRIATGGLAARLVRNADPRTDPNGDKVHRLPVQPALERAPGREPLPKPSPSGGDAGEWLGRWAVLAMFVLTTVLAGAFLVLWIAAGPAPSLPEAQETATAQPAAVAPQAPAALAPRPTTAAAPEPATTSRVAEDPAPAPPVPERPIETTGLKLTPGEIHALLSRGDALLAAGDVAAARSLLERAALAGDATAALRLGQSYDPGYLAGAGIRQSAGNLGLAIFWYRRGQELGNGTAAFLARKLETAARAGWGPISARPPAWRP